MYLLVLRVAYFLVCVSFVLTIVATGELTWIGTVDPPEPIKSNRFVSFFVLLAITQAVIYVDWILKKKRIQIISAVFFGLFSGYLLSNFVIKALEPILKDPDNVIYESIATSLITLVVTYFCISLLIQTQDDFRFIIPYVEFSRELKSGRPLIVDSSALIDGRIADVVDTNLFDAQMVVPQFILNEVQDIADSNDKMRRTRGRRGLEVLNKLQNNPQVDIRMHETTELDKSGLSVDQRLIEVAKELGGKIVTNDYNLNKVASVQNIKAINLNDVSNSLKPRYLPGEHLKVKIMKEGESTGQGVGFLDDGTMVVCENGAQLMGEVLDVVVTSVLQSSAGRMIFVRQYQNESDQKT